MEFIPHPNHPDCFQLLTNGAHLSFRQVLLGWQEKDFALSYSRALLAASRTDFFWEHPKLTWADLDKPYEVSLVPASRFDNLKANAGPFVSKFQGEEDSVLLFKNLSGSAWLVVPNPNIRPEEQLDYLSLKRFLQAASEEEIIAFWHRVGASFLNLLGQNEEFPYLSTHGLGVYWLHVRFDRRPKYYSTRRYR